MKKVLFLVVGLSITTLTFAQFDDTPSGILLDNQIQKRDNESKKELQQNEPTGLELDAKGKTVGATPEWSYTYLRFAQSSISFGEKEKGSSLSIGHRQVAASFYYDLQYNTLTTEETKSKAQAFAMGLGWQASWNHRLLPYVGVQVGYSWLSSDTLNVNGNGIYTGIDAGVILKRHYPFLFILGTRYGVHNYATEKVENLTVQEVYLSIGIEAF